TDHDTLAGLPEAVEAAESSPLAPRAGNPESAHGVSGLLSVIPGVEITTEFDGRELHLLGYFIRTNHAELNAALAAICASRRERFHDYVAKLAKHGHVI